MICFIYLKLSQGRKLYLRNGLDVYRTKSLILKFDQLPVLGDRIQKSDFLISISQYCYWPLAPRYSFAKINYRVDTSIYTQCIGKSFPYIEICIFQS